MYPEVIAFFEKQVISSTSLKCYVFSKWIKIYWWYFEVSLQLWAEINQWKGALYYKFSYQTCRCLHEGNET